MHAPPSQRWVLLQRMLHLHSQNTSAVPVLAKGREQITPLFLHAAAADVPAGKHFSPPANVSIVLEITFFFYEEANF